MVLWKGPNTSSVYYGIIEGPRGLTVAGRTSDTALVGPYLSEPQGLGVPHLLDVPEEGLLALLTGVAV